jgi:hypothetical protein
LHKPRREAILIISRRGKLLHRFLAKPADFRFDEMQTLLEGFGYEEIRTGKASGSRVAFVHRPDGHILRLHRPHPGNIVKRYQMELIEEALRGKGVIE